jgi:hypothetical protein
MERYDDFGHFILGAEQLSVSQELLLTSSAPKQRMAIILLDSLADALLYRLMERAFLYSDRAWFSHLLPLYPSKKRERARLHFSERLKIARAPSYDTAVAGYPALITETDTTILAVGHSYRNAAYHRDSHNPDVLATIGKVFFKPVGKLFVNAQLPGHGMQVTRAQEDRLRSVGININDGRSRQGMLYLRDAAAAFIATRNDGLDVAAPELARELAEDLVYRIQDARENIDYLREIPGDINEHLEWMTFWDEHAANSDLMHLKDARDAIIHKIKNMNLDQVTSVMREKEAEAANAYSKRFWELWENRETTTGNTILDSLADIEKLAGRLPAKRSGATIFQEYHKVDERLSKIERLLSEAVTSYDEYVNEQIH